MFSWNADLSDTPDTADVLQEFAVICPEKFTFISSLAAIKQ
jgi:hypothetical protein